MGIKAYARFIFSALLFVPALFYLTGLPHVNAQSDHPSEGDTVLFEKHSFSFKFETNRDHTDSIPEVEVRKLLRVLREYPEFIVRLEARTDSLGDPVYNLDLAQRRLNFARNELMERGVESDRFVEFVYGEDSPLASNQSAQGRRANRSVKVQAGLYSPVQKVSGRFTSQTIEEKGLEGIVFFGTRFFRDTMRTDSTGSFSTPAPKGEIFSLEFFSRDHILERTFFNPSRTNPSPGSIPSTVLTVGELFNFQDILFNSASAEVYRESLSELPRLLFMVSLAFDYRFEIQGHVNYPQTIQHSEISLMGLSESRAKTVYNYLIENGVEPDRLEWKGYANHKMLYPLPANAEEERLNMRVTVKILGKLEEASE
jgi:outer membrane protein OmpA-like peptidoglycan-associated protein